LSSECSIVSIKRDTDKSLCSDLNEDSMISDVKNKIHTITEIPHSSIEIRYGFPPKVLAADDDSTLKSSGISSGGKLKNPTHHDLNWTNFASKF
jgi:hypothetical protein